MSYLNTRTSDFVAKIVDRCGVEHRQWGDVFALTYADTLEKALVPDGQNQIFVLTGDIPAMWQRDSTAQIRPYLIPAQTDDELADIIERVINRQFFNMNIDPYANAFNRTENFRGFRDDVMEAPQSGWVWERKYELDSLCYPVQLAYLFWRNTGRTTQFNEQFESGVHKLLQVIKIEQNHEGSLYRFFRPGVDELNTLEDRVGRPVGQTGMVWGGFRPSDDASYYGYLVPSNLFLAKCLDYLNVIFREILGKGAEAEEFNQLAGEIRYGVQKYGHTTNKAGNAILAYEVDGLGHSLIMDDANLPNLVSLPYFDAIGDLESLYQETKQTMLSQENPYYYAGTYGAGLGSPHTPVNHIWPIGKSIEGLLADDKPTKAAILDQLVETTAGTNMMHESFNVENPSIYTREWFSWANMMFCELLLSYFDFAVKR